MTSCAGLAVDAQAQCRQGLWSHQVTHRLVIQVAPLYSPWQEWQYYARSACWVWACISGGNGQCGLMYPAPPTNKTEKGSDQKGCTVMPQGNLMIMLNVYHSSSKKSSTSNIIRHPWWKIISYLSTKVITRIHVCYKWKYNAHTTRMLNTCSCLYNLAKLKHNWTPNVNYYTFPRPLSPLFFIFPSPLFFFFLGWGGGGGREEVSLPPPLPDETLLTMNIQSYGVKKISQTVDRSDLAWDA